MTTQLTKSDYMQRPMGSASGLGQEMPWIETPLVESNALSRAAGCRVFLKLENLQPSGSFKSRGIGNLIRSYVTTHQRKASASTSLKTLHFYSSSGGNAGLGCVTAACSLGFPASVIVPTSTSQYMIAKLKAAGASEVIQHGPSWKYADAYLREVILPKLKEEGKEEGVYVPPFDHPLIWEGAGTMIKEIERQLPGNDRADAVICSVGGGGLFCGVIEGLDRVGWSDVRVLAMETIGADSLSQSLKADELVTLPAITSIATSLGAVRVAEKAFENASQRKNVSSVVLSDAEACMGAWRFADDERILVEPACGVSIAPCYDGSLQKLIPHLSPESKVVVVVCGGSNVTAEMMMQWREKFGGSVKGGRNGKNDLGTVDGVVPSTHTLPA